MRKKLIFLVICVFLIFGTWSLISLQNPIQVSFKFLHSVVSGATPVTSLDELSSIAGNDLLMVIDVSDNTMSVNGTNKKLQATNLGTVFGPGTISGATIDPDIFGEDAITAVTAPGTGVTIGASDSTWTITGLSTFFIHAGAGVSVSVGTGGSIYVAAQVQSGSGISLTAGNYITGQVRLEPGTGVSISYGGSTVYASATTNVRTYSIPFELDVGTFLSGESILAGSSLFGGISRFAVVDSGGSLVGVDLVAWPLGGATAQFYRSNGSFPNNSAANSLLAGSGVSTLSGGGNPCFDDLTGVTYLQERDIITMNVVADSGVSYIKAQLKVLKNF